MLLGMCDPTSLTRNGTCTPAVEARSLNQWAAGKVPSAILGPGLVKAQNDARKRISVAARCPHGSSCCEE